MRAKTPPEPDWLISTPHSQLVSARAELVRHLDGDNFSARSGDFFRINGGLNDNFASCHLLHVAAAYEWWAKRRRLKIFDPN